MKLSRRNILYAFIPLGLACSSLLLRYRKGSETRPTRLNKVESDFLHGNVVIRSNIIMAESDSDTDLQTYLNIKASENHPVQ